MAATFDPPVAIRLPDGTRTISSVEQAMYVLADAGWPGERGPAHRDAYETCLKVQDGHRSTADARQRFMEAARAAGILAGN